MEKIRAGSTPKSVVSLLLFPFLSLLSWSYWSWKPEVGTRAQTERAPGEILSSAGGVVKVERRGFFLFLFFPFFSLFSCMQTPKQFSGSINSDGSKSQTSERKEPSCPISGAVVPAEWSAYTLLFSLSLFL